MKNTKKKIFIIGTIIAIAVIVVTLFVFVFLNTGKSEDTNGGTSQEYTSSEKAKLDIEDKNSYNGERDYEKEASVDTISIPGYNNIILTEKYPKVKLVNDETNSVYLKYTIYNEESVIYETKAILPGNMVEANLYDLLDAGIYELVFQIETFDVKTEAPCNGTVQTVKTTIQK